ncbi:hypothetical protein CPAV1605_734 [seawater metagenome]|uniref:PQ loop repeat n=1 Tax=seawater metagenome TaxID=1561972 RepID=A0A5E8CK32_9ZZZZ
MNNLTKNITGSIGAFLSITLLPQLYQTYKSKKTRDLSLLFIIFQMITCIFFFVYGLILNELPLIISNCIVFFELGLLLYAKMTPEN